MTALAVDNARSQNLVANGSFESVTPNLNRDDYTVSYGTLATNAIANWIFGASGGAAYDGIVSSHDQSIFGEKVVADGSNAAVLQGIGSISQTLTLNPGAYHLSFYAMSRVPFGPNTILISLGDLLTETFTPTNIAQVQASDWIPYSYNFIVPTAGSYVLRFSGTIPFVRASASIPFSRGSDYSTFIDNVSVVPLIGPNSKRMSNERVIARMEPALPVDDIVFVGDSITAGATLSNPVVESPPMQCAQCLGQQYSMVVQMSNQGHSGHTTVDWLPSTNVMSDFHLATVAARALESHQPGQLIFSIMLGANDSAQYGPRGSPVSPAGFQRNLQAIIDQFLVQFPKADIFVHYPIFYSTNTQNGALYGPVGFTRLKSYLPVIDQLILNNATTHPGRVFAGDKLAFDFFATNYLADLTAESGVQGTFYLHPNAQGAVILGKFWASAIAADLHEPQLPTRIMTHAAKIRNLPPEECAKSLPVHLLGVMMDRVETDSDRLAIVLQDQTAGIYVSTRQNEQALLASFHRGDLLEIEGVTDNEQFAPSVEVQMAQKVGTAPIPAPLPSSYQPLVAGALDSQWVEIKGVVRECFDVESGSGQQRMVVEVDGGLVQVIYTPHPAEPVQVDAEVTVNGICLNRINGKRQAPVLVLQVPSDAPIIVEKPAPEDPFSAPSRSPANLWTFSPGNTYVHRLHVRGTVTYAQTGSSVWIRDSNRGLNMRTSQDDRLEPGDVIDALGFPAFGANAPRLEDGIFRKVGSAEPPIPVTLTNLDEGFEREDDLVSVQGTLTQVQSFLNGVSLSLDKNGQLFKAVLKNPSLEGTWPDWQAGATVRITGICIPSDDEPQPSPGVSQPPSFQILLRSPSDLEVLQPPSWWTLQHITPLLAVATTFLAVAVGIVVMTSRHRLRLQARQRQMAETEFAAILSERNRLAREIHDTLAQGMTATLVQLRLAKKQLSQGGETVPEHLDTALTLVGSSLEEARNSIWNMRAGILENNDLSGALKGILKQMADGTEIATSFEVSGKPRRLTPVIENNVLRIGQEAVTNSVRHSKARNIRMSLEFGKEQFLLQVADDGLGFDPQTSVQCQDGFGLVGMRERAAELNGRLEIRSLQGQGAEVTLSIPVLRDS